MKREDFKILVVNRAIYPGEEDYGGLDNHIRTLIAHRYSVIEERIPPSNMQDYDIIVAHPPQGFIARMVEFRKNHPDIPLVLDSGYLRGDRPSDYDGYSLDSKGVYYTTRASIQQFLKLIKGLTNEIYKKKALS